MSIHAGLHRLLRPIVIIMLMLAAAGCSSQAGAPVNAGDGAQAAPSAPAAGEEPAAGLGGESGRPAGDFAPIEQRIVKTGEVGLEVDDVAVILAQVRALAAELGGYVGGSQAGTLDQAASVTLRVPAERFDELITRLQELSEVEVVSMSTREEDVTGQVVDLAARIRNLKASEASYRVLYDRAERIEDVLTVQGRLDEVRGQIEQLEAQLTTVEAQAALSTLTVTIIPRDEPVADAQAGWDPGAQAATAVATLVGLAQGLFNALTWVVIVILPIALVIGLIAIVVMRVLPELRRRVAPAAPEASGEPPAG
jgi:FlaG/FlaF family flagellin (archaellin)